VASPARGPGRLTAHARSLLDSRDGSGRESGLTEGRWPRRLPHYRYVTVLQQSERARVAIMAARRDWIPVRWTAQERLLPEVPRIEFTHLSGWARGMEVAWTFDPIPGGTRVTILHDLDALRLPLVRSRWGRDIISTMFIQPIARRTLAGEGRRYRTPSL